MYVHLADNDGSTSHHWPAGRGNINFEDVFYGLRAIGYDGYVNVDFGGVAPNEIWEEVRRGRLYFENLKESLA